MGDLNNPETLPLQEKKVRRKEMIKYQYSALAKIRRRRQNSTNLMRRVKVKVVATEVLSLRRNGLTPQTLTRWGCQNLKREM